MRKGPLREATETAPKSQIILIWAQLANPWPESHAGRREARREVAIRFRRLLHLVGHGVGLTVRCWSRDRMERGCRAAGPRTPHVRAPTGQAQGSERQHCTPRADTGIFVGPERAGPATATSPRGEATLMPVAVSLPGADERCSRWPRGPRPPPRAGQYRSHQTIVGCWSSPRSWICSTWLEGPAEALVDSRVYVPTETARIIVVSSPIGASFPSAR